MKYLILSLFTVLLSSHTYTIYNQKRGISAILVDKKGEPVTGCNIVLKGTTLGTMSNQCGKFRIPYNSNTDTLLLSCLQFCLTSYEVNIIDIKDIDNLVMSFVDIKLIDKNKRLCESRYRKKINFKIK